MRLRRTSGVRPMASRILLQRMKCVFPGFRRQRRSIGKRASPCHTQFSTRLQGSQRAAGRKWLAKGATGWSERIFRAQRRGSRLSAIRGRCAWVTRLAFRERPRPGRTGRSWAWETRTRKRCRRFAILKRALKQAGSDAGRRGAHTDFCDQHRGVGKNWPRAWRIFCRDSSGDQHGAGQRS